jgi:tetratricopeptide (TPR) repeat protein
MDFASDHVGRYNFTSSETRQRGSGLKLSRILSESLFAMTLSFTWIYRASGNNVPFRDVSCNQDTKAQRRAMTTKPRHRKKSAARREGTRTTIRGDAHGPVLSGSFSGPVTVASTAPPSIRPLHQLPSAPDDFVGREKALRALTEAKGTGVAVFGVRGMGGIGKTALALKAAEALGKRYPDAQFYVDLRGSRNNPLTPAEALARIVRAYHPTARLPENEGELRAWYQSVLHGRRALVLLDDARDAAQVAPLLPPASCYLLVTSRQQFAVQGLKAYDLDTLPEADAVKLLLEIAPRIGDQAGKIARLCGYLPLALRLAASALQEHPTLVPAEYAARLRDASQRLKLVEASLALSFVLMPKRLQRLWPMLAVFPADFDRAAAAAVWGCSADEARDAADELVRLSLAGWDGKAKRLRLHDLARVFADSRLDAKARAKAQERHARHYCAVLRQANKLYLEGGENVLRGLAVADREWTNILSGQAWAAGAPQKGARLASAYPDAGAHVLRLRLHPAEQIRWREAGLAAARRSKDRAAQGRHLGIMGLEYAALSKQKKTIEFYKQALSIHREIGDRRGEGQDLNNLGLAYADLSQPKKAIEYLDQALAIFREIGDRRGEACALGNLGLAYADLGRPKKAIEYHEQALAIDREIGARRGEGANLGNLGLAYADLGQPKKAIKYHEQALAIDREIGARRGEGADLGNLGLAYADLGQPKKAIEYYKQALAISREIGNRRGEACDLGNLGNANYVLGRPKKAIEYHEQALAIDREIGDRRGEGQDLNNLGLAYADLGQPRKAIEFYEQHRAIAREIGDRRREGNALGNLGNAYADLDQPKKAIEFHEQAIAIFREIGDRLGEAIACWNLGLRYEALGDLDRAVKLMQVFVDFAREIGHPNAEKRAARVEALRRKIANSSKARKQKR